MRRKLPDSDGPLDSVKLPPGYYSAFVELHIEQGPLLEASQTAIGVVTKHRRSCGHASSRDKAAAVMRARS